MNAIGTLTVLKRDEESFELKIQLISMGATTMLLQEFFALISDERLFHEVDHYFQYASNRSNGSSLTPVNAKH